MRLPVQAPPIPRPAPGTVAPQGPAGGCGGGG